MKKALSVIISLMLTVSLFVGCQKNESKTTVQGTSTTTKEQSTKEATKEPVKLSVSHWIDDVNNYFPVVEEEMKKMYPEITITWEKIQGDQYDKILNTKLLAGEAADVIFNHETKKLAKAGYLEDLSSEPFIPRMLDGVKPIVTYKGKIYGVSLDISTFGAFYNKKAFDEMGLKEPVTWKEFIALCDQIKAGGKIPFVVGAKDVWPLVAFIFPITQNSTFGNNMNFGKDLYDGKIKMSDTGFKDALDKYTQLVKNGYFSKNTMGVGMDQSIQDFIDGKGLMILHGSWWPAVVSGKNKDMEIGFFPVPPDNGTELVMASGPDKILSINAKSKNIDVSKKFLEVATSQQALSVYCKNAALPGFKDIKAEFSLVMTKVAETVASSKTALNYDNYITKSANDILNKSLSAIMAGGNPDNVIEEMDAAYQRDKEQMDTFFE